MPPASRRCRRCHHGHGAVAMPTHHKVGIAWPSGLLPLMRSPWLKQPPQGVSYRWPQGSGGAGGRRCGAGGPRRRETTDEEHWQWPPWWRRSPALLPPRRMPVLKRAPRWRRSPGLKRPPPGGPWCRGGNGGEGRGWGGAQWRERPLWASRD